MFDGGGGIKGTAFPRQTTTTKTDRQPARQTGRQTETETRAPNLGELKLVVEAVLLHHLEPHDVAGGKEPAPA